MDSMVASSLEDRGFEPRSDQTIDYKIGMCCFPQENTTTMDRMGVDSDIIRGPINVEI
jgi:hypothetical protein